MCLHNKDKEVVKYTLIVISHLVLNDMLKLKGEIVDICMLLNLDDDDIKNHVRIFSTKSTTKETTLFSTSFQKHLRD